MQLDRALPLKNSNFSSQKMCSKCANPFEDGHCKTNIYSGKLSNKAQTLISIFQKTPEELNRKQKIKAKLYLKNRPAFVSIYYISANTQKL